ncbi:MAG TPA: hypothetical protein VG432_07900 [Gemmatimonadaceae bacterium]|nr:hypothetical protein [Gemmatimonadaceae bacterium]
MSEERESSVEPMPDPVLRAALADAFGEQPAGVDWGRVGARARDAAWLRLRARARVVPWWEQLTPWATRLLPLGAVAAAAALVLAAVTPRAATRAADTAVASSIADARDVIADAIAAPDGSSAVQRVAGPVSDDWLWSATAAAYAGTAP